MQNKEAHTHRAHGADAGDWRSTCSHNHYCPHNLSFPSLSPGPDLHLPTYLDKNSPDSSPGLCLLHDYKVGLVSVELKPAQELN